jgi:serine/threonine-protein kinase RsbW
MKTKYYPTSMELSIPSELGYEVVARDAVAAFALRMGFSHERVEDLKTALSEACINAIEHGNLLTPSLRVNVACTCNGDRLVVEVHDQGLKHHTPVHIPLSMADKMAGLGSMRGMGLLLIGQLMDESGFDPNSQDGNRFRLALYHQHTAESVTKQHTE